MIQLNSRYLCENCFSETKDAPCPYCGFVPGSPAQDPLALPLGSILSGRYKIGGVIGKGGFGITYLAYDLKLDARVAVKEYYPLGLAIRSPGNPLVSVSSGDGEVTFKTGAEKFYNEAKMVAKFNGNPNIVSVHDFFYENETVYFVMGYLQGETLKSYLKKKKITEGQAVNILWQMSNALLSSHSLNILHRDISPDNIMLCDDNTIRLLDFGASRQVMAEQSQSLSVILKQGFAPLEQYQQKGKQGPWTDIYALGATVYNALTGEMLLDPMSRMEDDSEYESNKYGISGNLWNIIKKCTMLKISDRYADIAAMKKDLQSVGIEPEEFSDVDVEISDFLRSSVSAAKHEKTGTAAEASDPNATMFLGQTASDGQKTMSTGTFAGQPQVPPQQVYGQPQQSYVQPQPQYGQPQQSYGQPQRKKINPLVIILPIVIIFAVIISVAVIFTVSLKKYIADGNTKESSTEVITEETTENTVSDKTSEDDESTEEDPKEVDTEEVKTEEEDNTEEEVKTEEEVITEEDIKTDDTDKRLEEAITAYDEMNYGTAFSLFLELAEEGNAEAQTNLAFMYHTGTGTGVNHGEALKWYRKAAAQGHPRGQELLGIMYYRGQGVDQDYSKAAEWFRKSAEQGYDEAQSNLGWMYINGLGVDVDYDEALKWCKLGAEQGNTHGEYNYGLMFENGYGVERDIEEARYWYTKAADQGNNDAIEGLKRLENY